MSSLVSRLGYSDLLSSVTYIMCPAKVCLPSCAYAALAAQRYMSCKLRSIDEPFTERLYKFAFARSAELQSQPI